MSLDMLGTIIEPRMEELFMLAKQELEKNKYLEVLGAGIVLTGGASLLKGSTELAEQVFDMPVKVGYPRGFNGITDIINNPSYSTVLGLVLYGTEAGSGGAQIWSGGRTGVISRTVDDMKKALSRIQVILKVDGAKILDVPLKKMPCLQKEMKQGGGFWEDSIHAGCEQSYLDTVVENEMELNVRAIADLRLSKSYEMYFSVDVDYTNTDCVEVGQWVS